LWLAAAVAGPAGEREAQGKPLWEIGGGAGVVVFPNYRGSREYNVWAAPLPLLIYRGRIWQISRDGVRAQLVDHPRFGINFSGRVSLPVDNDGDALREGMPDLDPTIKAGPRLSWLLSDPQRRERHSLSFDFPVYAVIATDLSDFEGIGVSIQPRLLWRQRWSVPHHDRDWSYSLSAGPLWASDAYHEYYYSVAPRFATPARPAFDASGGYSGFTVAAGLYHRRGRLRIGAYASVDYLRGAVFEDSPLVATTESYLGGFYLAWTFWESEARAPARLNARRRQESR
jgi:outer membrane scaffolding protein for murein synthesis (MipA/OmpV family)